MPIYVLFHELAGLLCRGFPHSLPDHQGAHIGGAGTPTRDPICLHLNVPTTWWLKSDPQSAYFNEW